MIDRYRVTYLLLRSGLLAIAMAGGAMTARAEFNPGNVPLDDATLSELRGGFRMGNLEIAIGLKQVIALNGETRVINQLSIPNINGLSPIAELTSNSQLIQHGMDDSFVLIANQLRPGAGIFTQIQNSLDQQVIQNMRTLDIEFSNAGGFNGFVPALIDSHFLQSPGR